MKIRISRKYWADFDGRFDAPDKPEVFPVNTTVVEIEFDPTEVASQNFAGDVEYYTHEFGPDNTPAGLIHASQRARFAKRVRAALEKATGETILALAKGEVKG